MPGSDGGEAREKPLVAGLDTKPLWALACQAQTELQYTLTQSNLHIPLRPTFRDSFCKGGCIFSYGCEAQRLICESSSL